MMNVFVFSRRAERVFQKLPEDIQDRIVTKLRVLKEHPNLSSVLTPLVHFEPATHRLRIGEYRLILEACSHHEYLILDVGHRSTIYR